MKPAFLSEENTARLNDHLEWIPFKWDRELVLSCEYGYIKMAQSRNNLYVSASKEAYGGEHHFFAQLRITDGDTRFLDIRNITTDAKSTAASGCQCNDSYVNKTKGELMLCLVAMDVLTIVIGNSERICAAYSGWIADRYS